MTNKYLIRQFYNSQIVIKIHNKDEFNELFKICEDLSAEISPQMKDYEYLKLKLFPYNDIQFSNGSFIIECRDDGEFGGLSYTFSGTDMASIENCYGKENIYNFQDFKNKVNGKETLKQLCQ